ncbi:hypothetical protein R6Q59_010150 [Mikania micrantha]
MLHVRPDQASSNSVLHWPAPRQIRFAGAGGGVDEIGSRGRGRQGSSCIRCVVIGAWRREEEVEMERLERLTWRAVREMPCGEVRHRFEARVVDAKSDVVDVHGLVVEVKDWTPLEVLRTENG